MKKILMAMVFATVSMGVYGKPEYQSINNYNNRVTMVFADYEADGEYKVSDVVFYPVAGKKGHEPYSVATTVTDGVATIVMVFPHCTHFSNPTVEFKVNGKEVKYKIMN